MEKVIEKTTTYKITVTHHYATGKPAKKVYARKTLDELKSELKKEIKWSNQVAKCSEKNLKELENKLKELESYKE